MKHSRHERDSESGAAKRSPLRTGIAAALIGLVLVAAGLIAVPRLWPGGASGNAESPTPANQGVLQTVPLQAAPLLRNVSGGPIVKASHGANDFAFRLSAALLEDANTTESFVCSPYSVWLPLAALSGAVQEQYLDALKESLGLDGMTMEELNQAASRMLYDLTNEHGKELHGESAHTPLKIANAIFVDNTVTLKQSFAQTFLDFYRGTSMNVDFDSPDAVDAVNEWVSDNTGGLIPKIVESFDSETVAALANAIYFSDGWQSEFREENTAEDVFHTPGGDVTAQLMLRSGSHEPYYEDERLQATNLGFVNGGGLLVLLPKDDDAAGLLSSMDETYFQEILDGIEGRTGKLLLPRFSAKTGPLSLNDSLKALGVPLFERGSLTGGLLEDPEFPVWMDQVTHSAFIQADEKGVTAAAVTVMGLVGAAMPQPEPFEMICNRPFVFILYGDVYSTLKQILFTGVINTP